MLSKRIIPSPKAAMPFIVADVPPANIVAMFDAVNEELS